MRKLSLGLVVMLLAAGSALASGGGGGGSGGGSFGDPPSSSTPQYDAAGEYRKGVDALQSQRFAEARKAFQHVLVVTPKDANAAYLAGMASVGAGDVKGGRRYFERAVKIDDTLIPAHQQLAIAAAQAKDVVKAQTELDWLKARAAQCGETCPQAADLRAAVSAVTAAIGGTPQALNDLAPGPLFGAAAGDQAYLVAVALINERHYDEAIASLQSALKAFGPHPDVLTYLGFANRKLGRYAVAEGYYREVLRLAPQHRGATEYYGELKVERGDLAGARAMLASLDAHCSFGCAEAEELRHWIDQASSAS